jgi:hypothetical protein
VIKITVDTFNLLGNHFINVDAVARVEVSNIAEDIQQVRVVMLSNKVTTHSNQPCVVSEVLVFSDEEKTIVLNYFDKLANQS